MSYGTGAIMAVPAHDTRDWEFAKKFGLPIIEVVAGGHVDEAAYTECHTGVMVNSGFLTGMTVEQAIPAMIDYLEKNGLGRRKVNYKLRDWVFTRQRYWGEPIPLVHCEHCGWVALPYDQLPLRLPEIEDYTPSDDGSSALSRATEWMHTTCPKCGGPAIRETDTMPNWAGSSWYFLRYCDPHNDKAFADYDELKYWMPVDWYNGGMEHTTLHLLYSRFWHRFLYDCGLVPCPEPYMKRTSHGLVLGENGEKMSNPAATSSTPTRSWTSWARIRSACMRCSWARSTSRSRGTRAGRAAAAVSSSGCGNCRIWCRARAIPTRTCAAACTPASRRSARITSG